MRDARVGILGLLIHEAPYRRSIDKNPTEKAQAFAYFAQMASKFGQAQKNHRRYPFPFRLRKLVLVSPPA